MSLENTHFIGPQPFLSSHATSAINDAIRSTNETAIIAGPGGTNSTRPGNIGVAKVPFGTTVDFDVNQPSISTFQIVMVNAGPNGEDDFPDARYWAREVAIVQNDNFDDESDTEKKNATNTYINAAGWWGVVYNVGETITQTHMLPTVDPTLTTALKERAFTQWGTLIDACSKTKSSKTFNSIVVIDCPLKWVMCAVTSNTLLDGQEAAWEYQLTPKKPNTKQTWATVDGMDTITGYNSIEANNPSTGIGQMGSGWSVSSDEFANGIKLQPIQGSPVLPVLITLDCNGDPIAYFQGWNVKGECPA